METSEVQFGVELEFTVVVSPDEHMEAENARVRDEIGRYLAKHTDLPIATQCPHAPHRSCTVCDGVDKKYLFDGGRVYSVPLNHEGLVDPEYHYFFLKSEIMLLPDDWQDEHPQTCVEIASPVFPQSEIRAGLPQLKQLMSMARKMNFQFGSPPGCGLHHHVGLKNGLNARIAKKAITLILLIENSLIVPLSLKSRREEAFFLPVGRESRLAKNQMGNGFLDTEQSSQFAEMAQNFPVHPHGILPAAWNKENPNWLFETMCLLWRAKNMLALSKMLSTRGTSRTSVALELRQDRDAAERNVEHRGPYTTLEFRYPQMTFDKTLIEYYTQLWVRIVDLAQLDAPQFGKLVGDLIIELNDFQKNATDDKKEQPHWKLLDILELGHQIPKWQEEVLR